MASSPLKPSPVEQPPLDPCPFRIGLTGGIGSGKSLVAGYFASLGIAIVDTDLLAREIVEPGQPALAAIQKRYGKAILQDDGTLNRAALRDIIFDDPAEKAWLESLTHPLINQLAAERLENAPPPYVLLVSALLFEAGQDRLVDKIIVVDVDEQAQVNRASARDKRSQDAVQKIINAQISRDERLKRADFVIDNSRSEQDTYEQVCSLSKVLLDCHNLQS